MELPGLLMVGHAFLLLFSHHLQAAGWTSAEPARSTVLPGVHNYLGSSADVQSATMQVGRAGRFGTKGLAITFVSSEQDSQVLNMVSLKQLCSARVVQLNTLSMLGNLQSGE